MTAAAGDSDLHRNGKKMKMTGDGNGIRGRGNAEIVAAKMSGAGGLLFFGGCVV